MTTKTTWLVGAGISKDAGYPLVSDFLKPEYYQRMLKTSQFRDGTIQRILPRFEKFAQLGKDVNSLMAHYLDTGDSDAAHELNSLILLTLDEVRWSNHDDYYIPYIHAFADLLGASEASVLSFNYDTLIEELVTFLYIDHYVEQMSKGQVEPVPYTLGIDETKLINVQDEFRLASFGAGFLSTQPPTRGGLKLLKLHGSTCLRYCVVCRSVSYVIPPVAPSEYLFSQISPGFKTPCSKCGKDTDVALLFVPPASDERFPTWEMLNRLWDQARKELHSSDILVIAGYSLPADDKRARKLLEEVAAARPELRVLVVDPVLDENFQDRFRNIFPQAVFIKRSFKGLMALLVTLRSRNGPSLVEDLEPEAKDLLLAMVTPTASRVRGELPGSLPLTTCLDDCFESNDMTWDHRRKALKLLGLSSAFQSQIARAAVTSSDNHLRGLCAKALGDYANQEAVDVLTLLVSLTAPIELKLSPHMKNTFILPESIATFALVGLRRAAAIDPWLIYAHAVIEIAKATETMMEIDRVYAGKTLEFIYAMRTSGQQNALQVRIEDEKPQLSWSARLSRWIRGLR